MKQRMGIEDPSSDDESIYSSSDEESDDEESSSDDEESSVDEGKKQDVDPPSSDIVLDEKNKKYFDIWIKKADMVGNLDANPFYKKKTYKHVWEDTVFHQCMNKMIVLC